MDDKKIVDLFFARDERALEETQSKYGGYCFQIAYHILNSVEDSEETVNDTYVKAWESMPPHRPTVLSAFLGKITRRLSMNRLRYTKAQKRIPQSTALALDELSECVPDRKSSVSEEMEAKELGKLIESFIETLRATDSSAATSISIRWTISSKNSSSRGARSIALWKRHARSCGNS